MTIDFGNETRQDDEMALYKTTQNKIKINVSGRLSKLIISK